jgi:predicted esterase
MSFKETVQKLDPPFLIRDGENPFLGKRVLVLSGEIDRLVPWDASKEFVERLEVGQDGVKKVSLYRGVGHECTDEMVKEMAEFISNHCL